MNKDSIRQDVLARRKLALDTRREASANILDKLRSIPEYKNLGPVLFFAGNENEVDTIPAISEALTLNRTIALPYVKGDALDLSVIKDISELKPGAFNILEPKAEIRNLRERKLSLPKISIILVPGVAFARDGHRLGYGKGYYDRFLAALPNKNHLLTIGLCFDCQIVQSIPFEEHDRRVDLIISDRQIIDCRN